MPSRKQRRRREKSRRHEYEYVYVDGEGREVEVPPDAVATRPAASAPAKGSPAAKSTRTSTRGAGSATSRRRIEPPSWRRAGKRALIFAPIMFLTITFVAGDLSIAARVFQTAYLLLIFIPFTYLMDRIMYRRFVKQEDAAGQARRS